MSLVLAIVVELIEWCRKILHLLTVPMCTARRNERCVVEKVTKTIVQ